MGLSLFGVFELPVPGIIPSAAHHREGYIGTFNTGIIATLLGTPCIGPFVAPVFTWGLTQPPIMVLTMFGLMGLGMAFPFLMTGLFPQLVNWLPRPGDWMVKFKQCTGFALMGTVIWLMYSVPAEWQVPVLILFLGLSLTVWLSANLTSPMESAFRQMRGYAVSLLAGLPVCLLALWMMQRVPVVGAAEMQVAAAPAAKDSSSQADGDVPGHMPWLPFSEDQLVKLRKEGRPMLIDFTANWCVLCKMNERIALDRQETVKFITENGVVPLLADFTNENAEILKYLRQFGQDSVPLTVIIPPGRDSKVIALRGAYSKSTLLQKLKEAVGENPSSAGADTVRQSSGAAPQLGAGEAPPVR
jgi:thiol:disulfide interchange protein